MNQKMKNTKIAQKVINRPDVLGTEFSIEDDMKADAEKERREKEIKASALLRKSKQFDGLAEHLAQDKFYKRNHIWPGAKQAFPLNVKMQTVDKYFPYAEGGPLFIDEPNRTVDLKQYEAKKKAMKDLGHRYLLIEPGMSDLDAVEAIA